MVYTFTLLFYTRVKCVKGSRHDSAKYDRKKIQYAGKCSDDAVVIFTSPTHLFLLLQ